MKGATNVYSLYMANKLSRKQHLDQTPGVKMRHKPSKAQSSHQQTRGHVLCTPWQSSSCAPSPSCGCSWEGRQSSARFLQLWGWASESKTSVGCCPPKEATFSYVSGIQKVLDANMLTSFMPSYFILGTQLALLKS